MSEGSSSVTEDEGSSSGEDIQGEINKTLPSVVIVGAGFAGISAALRLINNGITNVTVLEAQDYVGGRVKSVNIDGVPADLGAQFIHGRVGNPLYDMAERLGRIPAQASVKSCEESLFNQSQLFYTSDGKKIQMDEVRELVDLLEDIDLDTLPDGCSFDIYGGPSLQSAVDATYEDFLATKGPVTKFIKEVYDGVVRWFCKYIQIDNASTDLRQLAQYSDYKVLAGERFTEIEGGMAGLLATLASLLPEGTVKLNSPVSQIYWNQSGSNPVRVVYGNSDSITADHVVVTASLGYLRANHLKMFNPPLPRESSTAFEHCGFGAIGKIYLVFPSAVWDSHRDIMGDEGFESFEFLWLDSHLPNIPSDRSKRKTEDGWPWWRGLHSCETVAGHANVLELWLGHHQCRLSEDLEDAEVAGVATEVLHAFLPHLKLPRPTAVYRTSWLSNPWTHGSYSFPTLLTTQADATALATPLPSLQSPHLLFAGEGVSRHFASTAHGALDTGVKAADTLLTRHRRPAHTDLLSLLPDLTH